MVTYAEALEKSIQYFQGSKVAAKVFVDKYALKDKEGNFLEFTPAEMHHRLAREFARIEAKYPNPLSEEEIFGYLDQFKYIIPQGSPMAGIGNKFQRMSLSNCFVIQSPYDSMSGIGHTIIEEKEIMKRRGGVGFDISTIRPKGMPTSNAAGTTDGIEVFMEDFSDACRRTAQNGRRGALMLTISVHHPEIRTFINVKRDKKKVTGANLSIRLSDEFMQAVKEGVQAELRFPVDSPDPKIREMVDARALWNEIILAAHDNAEPGLLFWDTVMKYCPANCYPQFTTISTNPCQPGWATVLTPQGIRTFNNINVGDVIWSGKRWTKVVNKFCTGVKPVYAYKTRAGVFYGTENHRVVSRGEKIEAAQADSIDTAQGRLSLEQADMQLDPLDIMDGLVWGDGTYHKASNKVFLHIGQDDQCYFDSEVKHLILEHRPGIKDTAYAVETRNIFLKKTYERELHPNWLYSVDQKGVRGFLRGLFSANGTVVGGRVQLKSACLKLVEQVQEMLSMLGINSYYTTNKAHEVEFENGTYECKESYDLSIGTKEGRQLFQRLIGFIHPDKQQKLQASLELRASSKPPKVSYEIVETQALGEEKVYDITVEADEHTYWTGGLLVSNCGEITLSAFDSCRLLLMNTLSFVENPYTKQAKMNWKEFARVVRIAQRLMDDLVDLELEAIDSILEKIKSDPEPAHVKNVELTLWQNIREACVNGRRTGLGLTAVGDTVAALGARYGSEDSIHAVELIYRTLALNSYASSVQLAEERGAFPAFSHDLEKDHPFLKRIWDAEPELHEKYLLHGRRNIANLTTPPAGSTSMLAKAVKGFGTTSGIENVLFIRSIRRKKINPTDKDAKVDFVDDLGDKWQEFPIYHPGFEAWMEINDKTDANIQESPYWNSTADDVDWVAKVDMQGVAQKWIDHSISNTTNLPENVTVDTVKDVYMRGWERGCKGVTIYRKNSRAGVVLDEKEAKKVKGPLFQENHAPKRPTELECDVYHSTIQGEKWTIFVGKLDGRPYEIMGGLAKFVTLPKRVRSGKIVKHNGENNSARYDFYYDYEDPENETIIKDIGNVFENPVNAAFTRTISLSLRHGVPVQYVCEQLAKGAEKESDLFSFSKVTARVLKNYIKDGTKVSQKKCPDCGSASLSYQSGCVTCLDCGSGKCG